MWQSTVKCDVGTAESNNGIVKCEKKNKMTKELSNMMLELHNVRIKPSNVMKKEREPQNMTKVLSNVMLELYNVRMEPSNVRE